MSKTLPAADIVVVGFGWAGGIMATELAATGRKIVVLERGGAKATGADFVLPGNEDEIRYARRHELMQDVTRETITFRNNSAQRALPMRRLGSFLPGETVGGTGVHWGAATWRWLEWDHEARSRTVERYGAKFVPNDMLLQDWGVSYAQLEPYYDKFERAAGTSGKAGNLRGAKKAGGNPFEGPRRRDYPNPPLSFTQSTAMFDAATKELGYSPFPLPSSIASRPYTNPNGVAFGPCSYCGFCVSYGCEMNAKASPHFVLAPLVEKHANVELRTHARVLKVNLDSTGKKAVGVTYIDAQGRTFDQPAELVILCAYSFLNVHLMLLSGIGTPYDPVTGKGVVGRSYAYQAGGGAAVFLDEKTTINPFMASGGTVVAIDDLNGGNYDFAAAGFIGGAGLISGVPGGSPISFRPVPSGTPKWGSAWKAAAVKHYNHTTLIANQGAVMSYRQNYLDLDPNYRDPFGRPLLRMTFDFQPNEVRQMNRMADEAVRIGKAMGAARVDRMMSPIPYSIGPYQSTHNTGGAVMGVDPAASAVNHALQSWDVPNVFVVGASALPQNAGRNPTGPVGALAFRTAELIRTRYLQNPGALL